MNFKMGNGHKSDIVGLQLLMGCKSNTCLINLVIRKKERRRKKKRRKEKKKKNFAHLTRPRFLAPPSSAHLPRIVVYFPERTIIAKGHLSKRLRTWGYYGKIFAVLTMRCNLIVTFHRPRFVFLFIFVGRSTLRIIYNWVHDTIVDCYFTARVHGARGTTSRRKKRKEKRKESFELATGFEGGSLNKYYSYLDEEEDSAEELNLSLLFEIEFESNKMMDRGESSLLRIIKKERLSVFAKPV